MRGISKIMRFGIVFICMGLEMVILLLRSLTYDSEDVLSYEILFLGIFFGCIVAVLWLLDKKEEQKKIQELTSYVHKTREIIPSVGRMLKRLEQSADYPGTAGQIIEELRSICESDMQETCKEAADLKTFVSTGCLVLDEQLERYLGEACKNAFALDVIVRAPVNEILDAKQIDRYQLLQLVGDLYRNACKAVSGQSGGRILICFGYNMDGFYEIAVYDNAAPFEPYVLDHLGERGITTNGTGHGIADIFEVLRKNRGSFVLNQNMPDQNIFRKGVCIIFDGFGRIEIYK